MIAGFPASKFGQGPCFGRLQATGAVLGLDWSLMAPHSVLIVGSNGKGTTAAMTAAGLMTRGRTGLFTSPHLMSVTERIAINGTPIALDALEALSLEVAAARTQTGVAGQAMGSFEHLFLIAALAFERAGCAHIVWEAGIGGRLDPTRLVRARIGALTSLDLEHTALLGETLTAIGQDKLDGFAPGAEVLVGPSAAPVWPDLSAYAALTDKTLTAPLAEEATPFQGLEADFLSINASLAWGILRRLIGDDPEALAAIAGARLPGRVGLGPSRLSPGALRRSPSIPSSSSISATRPTLPGTRSRASGGQRLKGGRFSSASRQAKKRRRSYQFLRPRSRASPASRLASAVGPLKRLRRLPGRPHRGRRLPLMTAFMTLGALCGRRGARSLPRARSMWRRR